MSVVSPHVIAATPAPTLRPRRDTVARPPRAELAAMRGILIGLALVLPFWVLVGVLLASL